MKNDSTITERISSPGPDNILSPSCSDDGNDGGDDNDCPGKEQKEFLLNIERGFSVFLSWMDCVLFALFMHYGIYCRHSVDSIPFIDS